MVADPRKKVTQDIQKVKPKRHPSSPDEKEIQSEGHRMARYPIEDDCCVDDFHDGPSSELAYLLELVVQRHPPSAPRPHCRSTHYLQPPHWASHRMQMPTACGEASKNGGRCSTGAHRIRSVDSRSGTEPCPGGLVVLSEYPMSCASYRAIETSETAGEPREGCLGEDEQERDSSTTQATE